MARSQTVLLVAKDHLTRCVTSAGLSKYGYEVLTAECADRASDILRSKSTVGVLVIDLDLTANSGLGVAGLAQEMNPRIELIYTSRAPHLAPPAAQTGDALVLRDPYQPHQLAGIIAMRRKARSDPSRPSGACARTRR